MSATKIRFLATVCFFVAMLLLTAPMSACSINTAVQDIAQCKVDAYSHITPDDVGGARPSLAAQDFVRSCMESRGYKFTLEPKNCGMTAYLTMEAACYTGSILDVIFPKQ